MPKRHCYQCPEGVDLDEIRDRRNAEIRAWGKQVLLDADKALIAEQGGAIKAPSDWDLLDEDDDEETGTDEDMDALAATEPQETKELQKKIDESPKPEAQANDESKEDVVAGDAPVVEPAPEAPKRGRRSPSKETTDEK